MKRTNASGIVTLVLCGLTTASVSLAETNAISLYHALELEYPMTDSALYQLQATDNLLGTWSNSGPAVVGEDCSESFLQSTRDADRKFWRVVEGSVSNVLDFSQARSLTSTNYVLFENVLWHGTNWMALYRLGSVFHQTELTPLRTLQIPAATIVLDGSPADWTAVPVVYADAQHDQEPPDNHPGTDIQQYKIARDSSYIYMAYWLYDANPAADTMYFTEFQLYLNQMHTPGDTMVCASYSEGDAEWQVSVSHREHQGGGITYGSSSVGIGTKFIEYNIPIADIEYDGGGEVPRHGIETRFLRTYVHYVHDGDVQDPLSTYDGAGEDDDEKVMIVKFY